MADKNIDQKIEIPGTARDVMQIGVVRRFVQIVKNPAAWQDAVWIFLTNRWDFLLLTIALEGVLWGLYRSFADLYLIPLWVWGIAAVCLTISTAGWFVWSLSGTVRMKTRGVTLGSTGAVAAIVAWQAVGIAFPAHFDRQVFGIALAELGEGPDYYHTGRAKEISQQVYKHLCTATAATLGPTIANPCDQATTVVQPFPVRLARLGVIPSPQEAKRYGTRIGADVVIWGSILTSGGGKTNINFQVLEPLDQAANPDTPIIVPLTQPTLQVFGPDLNVETNPEVVERAITAQTTFIAAFMIGVKAYLERDYITAVRQLTAANDAAQALETDGISAIPLPSKGLLHYYLGKASHGRGQIDEGQRWLNEASGELREEPAVPLSLALGAGSLGKVVERTRFATAALTMTLLWRDNHPGDQFAYYDLGIAYQILKRDKDALAEFDAANRGNQHFYIAYLNAAQTAKGLAEPPAPPGQQLRYLDIAIDRLQHAITEGPTKQINPWYAHLVLAQTYDATQNPDEATREFRAAISLAPREVTSYDAYCQFLGRQPHLEEDKIRFYYRTMIDVAPSTKRGWANGRLADFLRIRATQQPAEATHYNDEAATFYETAILEEPNNWLLRTHLAETYAALGRANEADAAFGVAAAGNADDPYIFASYAGFLYTQGELARAASMYEMALRVQPDQAAVLLNLGQTYETIGQGDPVHADDWRAKAGTRYCAVNKGKDASEAQIAAGRLQALGRRCP